MNGIFRLNDQNYEQFQRYSTSNISNTFDLFDDGIKWGSEKKAHASHFS